MTTRFVIGTHTVRNGKQVVEVFEGDNFVAAIYPVEHGIRIVSSHFAVDPTAIDEDYPPVVMVRFAGSEPPGRARLDNGPVITRDREDD
jgi:hypothetical protein